MPYSIRGKSVYKKEGGKLIKVGESDDPPKYLRTLQAIEHGFKPSKKKAKKTKKGKK